ncbi:MAG: hypothetical protein H7281_02450 [Bacteriovorax sp.]|nr:hypothetical protein [Bacteriovorax sp.]
MTNGFPATTTVNSEMKTKITLPESCVAPVVFVMAGSEEKWFSVTGAEMEPKKINKKINNFETNRFDKSDLLHYRDFLFLRHI